MCCEGKEIWHSVICGRYGEEVGWRSCEVRDAYGVRVWKTLRIAWDVVGE